MNLAFEILGFLSRRRKVQLFVVFSLMLASGVAEMASLASSVPFLAVLSEPQQLWKYAIIRDLAFALGITEAYKLLIPISLLFAMAVLLAALVRLLNLWSSGQLAAAIGSDLSCEAYRRTLYQPYKVHISRNSSEVITAITTHTSEVVLVINASLQMMTNVAVSFSILIALFVIDRFLALIAVIIFGLAYYFVSRISRGQLSINSSKIASANQHQLQALQEGLGAIRDVLLDNKQNVYLEIYECQDRPLRMLMAQNRFLGSFPRYVLEALGLILIALIALYLSLEKNDSPVIPLLGVLAIGSQRLLPAFQQIYSGWSLITAFRSGVSIVFKMLKQPLPSKQNFCEMTSICDWEIIRFQNVGFQYSRVGKSILSNVNLQIKRGECIGLIGASGSGKSTLVDLLMGLLEPTEGAIVINEKKLHDTDASQCLQAWRSSIAHVPQTIFLADKSIAENIAFGIPKDQINFDNVRNASKQARLEGLVQSSSDGYDTRVGEWGVKLSGGQRQRIGIARALYKKASLIVFDEATSALDMQTEAEVMSTIHDISDDVTIVVIAHRLSTLNRCDRIFKLDSDSCISVITPNDLLPPSGPRYHFS